MSFSSASALEAYLPATGPIGPLTADLSNPTSSSSGAFGSAVASLQLNVQFSDAGLLVGTSDLRFGNLTLCGYSTLPALNGTRIRDLLAMANTLLGGGSAFYTINDIADTVITVSGSFVGGTASAYAQSHLVNGPCP